jgi:hypothetical protein
MDGVQTMACMMIPIFDHDVSVLSQPCATNHSESELGFP